MGTPESDLLGGNNNNYDPITIRMLYCTTVRYVGMETNRLHRKQKTVS